MPLIGCQIGSAADTERVDGPPRIAVSIGPAPRTCTIRSPCCCPACWARDCCACCAAFLALSSSPIGGLRFIRVPGWCPERFTHECTGPDWLPIPTSSGQTGTRFSFLTALGRLSGGPEAMEEANPGIEGCSATDESGPPLLTGSRWGLCGTYVFPPRALD